LNAEGSPIPAMKIDQFKDFLRNTAKQAQLSPAEIKRVTDILPGESAE
jgi:hypothetical protein